MKVFECKLCGECCRGKGGISISDDETAKIASFVGMETGIFAMKYTYRRHGRTSIRSGRDKHCVFFDTKAKCLIHPIKPEVCRLWPFFQANLKDRQSWEMAREACPGINPDASFEEFIEESKKWPRKND